MHVHESAQRRVSFQQLRLVVAILELGTLRKAAAALHVTQPAATRILKDLEASVGTALFERSRAGMHPTAQGRRFAEHGRVMLGRLQRSVEEIRADLDGITGEVAIGILPTVGQALLPGLLATLVETHPGIRLRMVEGINDRLVPRLLKGEIELLVGRLPVLERDVPLVQEAFYDNPIEIVCRPDHPLTREPRLTLARLAGEQWILPDPGTTLRNEIDMAFTRAGIKQPRIPIESSAILTNSFMIQSNDLLTIVPGTTARRLSDLGVLTILRVAIDTRPTPIGVTSRSPEALSPAALVVIALFRDAAAGLRTELGIR